MNRFLLIILILFTFNKQVNMEKTKDDRMDVVRFKQNVQDGEYNFTEIDGTRVRQFDSQLYYVEESLSPNAYFGLYREFYLDGKIKKKGVYFLNGFNKGVWETYDEDGRVIDRIDYDEPYKQYPWEVIEEFCNQHKINLFDERTSIARRKNEKGDYVWIIIWDNPKRVKGNAICVTIDVKTRKVISEVPVFYEK